ncbi:protein GVQW3-like [Palaemon carinicauda]|uniref:protein GVQW3-like n=1 Tax=Palaemon carinicauda TaxID=392227 RepID=UPI0035B640E9
MTERAEQRYHIKFCQKHGDSKSETIRKIQQVFGDDAMGVTQIQEWFTRFKSGHASAESDQRSGRPQTARSAAVVERVRNLVMAGRRSTVQEIAQEVGMSKDSAHVILRDDLNMHSVCEIFAQIVVAGTKGPAFSSCKGPSGHCQHCSSVSEHRDNWR